MGCSVVLCRPGCRDKVLLQPQFREGSYRTASAVAEPAAYTRQSTARGLCREDGWRPLTLQVLDQLAPELVAVGDVSIGQEAGS